MRMAPHTRVARKAGAMVVIGALTLAPWAAGPAQALPAQAAPATIEALVESKFAPETLTVPIGTEVTWVNKGGAHTVVGGADALDPASPIGDNPLAAEGDTVKKTFDKAGTYPYFCLPHQSLGMKGVVIVTAAAAGGAAPAASPAPSDAAPAASPAPSDAAPAASPAPAASAPSDGAAPSASGSAPAGGSAAPAGAPGAAGGAGPAGAPAGSAAVGSASVGATAPAAVSASPYPADKTLGAAASETLASKLESESKPLTSFRLALGALTLAILLLSAGVYFVTKTSRDES